MERRTLMWSVTGISAVVGFMLTVQMTSKPQGSPSVLSSYLDLRTQLLEQMQQQQVLDTQIAKENAQLDLFKASNGNTKDLKKALENDAETVSAEAGMTPLDGPGITITIEDNPNLPFVADYAGKFQQYSDQEISQIVNDLFANGAKAISINGQRLVTTSSIRLVSGLGGFSTLQVNTYPVSMPYVISAVGNVELMQAVLNVQQVVTLLNLMQEDCLVALHPAINGVTVPGYHGPLPGTWAKEVNHG